MTTNSDPSSGSNEDTELLNTGSIDDNNASAPSAEKEVTGAKPESLLDAVKSVLDPAKDKAKSPTADKDNLGKDSKAKAEGADKDDGTQAKQEETRLDKHPRFKELVAERNNLRAQNEDYQQIQSFMARENLSVNEVTKGFQIMAAMKNNPAEALKMIAPHFEQLQQFIGDKLPADLQERVNDGYLDAQSAKELAFRRNQEGLHQAKFQQHDQRQSQQAQQYEQAQQQRAREDMGTAVTQWEESVKARDADYPQKAKLVETAYRVLMQQAPPKTQHEAVQLAERALAEVNEQTRAFRQQKQQVRGPRSTNSSTSATAAPKTLKEAILLGLRK